jgi:hypothetical protein
MPDLLLTNLARMKSKPQLKPNLLKKVKSSVVKNEEKKTQVVKGEKGKQGEKGEKGLKGDQGPAGPSGTFSLSSSPMSTIPKNYIGYKITTTSNMTNGAQFSNNQPLAILGEELTPSGSVWIIETYVLQYKNQISFNTGPYRIEVQEGETYNHLLTAENSIKSNVITIISIDTKNVKYENGGLLDSATAIYVVSNSNTSKKLVLGIKIYDNMSSYVSNVLLQATRIA